jgi:hypothetical protein
MHGDNGGGGGGDKRRHRYRETEIRNERDMKSISCFSYKILLSVLKGPESEDGFVTITSF